MTVFQAARWKIVSRYNLPKLSSPTNTPGSRTVALVRLIHTPLTNGYAMNRPSRMTVGNRRTAPSTRSSSRACNHLVARGSAWGVATGRAAASTAPPDPPAILRALTSVPHGFRAHHLAIDLLEFALRPFDRLLGRHALDRLGVHVDDDVFRVHLAGLGRGRPFVAEQPEGPGRRPVRQHDRVLLPHRMLFPVPGGTHAEPALGHEPLLELRLGVQPRQEILGDLRILGIAHHPVMEGRMIVE